MQEKSIFLKFCLDRTAPKWLLHEGVFLDPDLQLYRGRQYVNDDKNIFGLFSDSCPDRWGRLLMKRREAVRAGKANEKPRKLSESDFLLGVMDLPRMGGLRFKTETYGEFLADDKDFAIPPWTSLRELEAASAAFENDDIGWSGCGRREQLSGNSFFFKGQRSITPKRSA